MMLRALKHGIDAVVNAFDDLRICIPAMSKYAISMFRGVSNNQEGAELTCLSNDGLLHWV